MEEKLFVVLKRTVFSTKSTIGELYANGEFVCNTLEDVDRSLHQWMPLKDIKACKVDRVTAIPRGFYHCKMTMSPRFQKIMPEIYNVPGFAGVRMHAGNKAENTEGCPLLGDYNPKQPDWISNSTNRKNEFYALVDKYGGEFDLVIC